jgi:LDH2 family malate/lactate/ureidoglycolate dehydrogenase
MAAGSDEQRISATDLEAFCVAALTKIGASDEAARVTAASLIDADLRGLEFHGVVARLPEYYGRAKAGGTLPSAEVQVVSDDGPTAVLDAGGGLGQVAAMAAVDTALERAGRYGLGAVAVRNSNHLGAVGYYTRKIAEAGAVGFAVSGSQSRIAPWGGAEPLLGTNPWSWGFPARDRPPVVIDVSNGVVILPQITNRAARNEPIPEGWGLDERGLPTTDGNAVVSQTPMGEAKGNALTFAMEILTSVFTGAAFSWNIPSGGAVDTPQQVGHFVLAMSLARFTAPDEFAERLESLLVKAEQSRPVEGGPPVRIPGTRGDGIAAERRTQGIPLAGRREPLDRIAAELGIDPLP